MKNITKRFIGIAFAAVMLTSSLAAGGCAQTPAPPTVSETVVSETEVNGNIPGEYIDLFHGGSFDEENIWTTDDETYADLIAKLRPLCDKSFNGSLMVATDDKVIFAGGWAAKETDGETTVNPFTTYEIGSVTKQFCAVAILQQVQEGKIDVNDTIDKYFPEYPHGAKITVDNLLHMDSGIPEMLSNQFHGGDFMDNEAFMDGTMPDEDLLRMMYGLKLDFEPGGRFAYSNTNYWLLALILEQVTGQPYEEYVQQNIFDVCDMPCSSACATGDLTSKPELGYDYMYTAKCCRGAGDIHSNVCDMLRWDRNLFGGRLLNEEQMEYMTTLRKGYSCGWMDDGFDGLGHSGGTWGYASYNCVFDMDGENIYVSVMTGNQGSAAYGLKKVLETVDKVLP